MSWNPISALSFLTEYFSFKPNEDSIGVAQISAKKIIGLRRLFIIIGATAIISAIEANSPNYSVYEYLQQIMNAGAAGSKAAIQIPGYHAISVKSLVKIITFLLAGGLIWMQIAFADPLANHILLRSIAKRPTRYPPGRLHGISFYPAINDQKKFSSLMPSSSLPRLCETCAHGKDCESHIENDETFLDKYSFPIWRHLYYSGAIPAKSVSRLASVTLRCRTLYYTKIVSLNVAYISLAAFCAHRIIEHLAGKHMQFPPLAIAPILVGLTIPILTGRNSDSTGPTELSGIWAHLKGATDEVSGLVKNSQEFHAEYSKRICTQSENQHQYKRSDTKSHLQLEDKHIRLLESLLQHLDKLIANKLAQLIVRSKGGQSRIDYANGVIKSCQSFYEKTFAAATPICASHLESLSSLDIISASRRSFSLEEIISRSIREKGFYIGSSQAAPVGVKFLVGSFMILPIDIPPQHMKIIRERIEMSGVKDSNFSPPNFGWLCITSKNEWLFTHTSAPFHITILNQFINRITFELIRDFVKVKGGSK